MEITADFARVMARYNTWQNNSLLNAASTLDETALTLDRGAFFGSILGTCNHLLWGDTIWMSRFGGVCAPPSIGIKYSPTLHPNWPSYADARREMDGHISAWADSLADADLANNLTWFSGATGKEQTKPRSLLVMHVFNHQTHHRGQIHAMLTAAGAKPDDTDLFILPQP